MQQTKLASFIESLANVIIGYFIGVISQILIFPVYNIHIPHSQNMSIAVWFAVISLARSYVLRRWFNARLHNLSLKAAEKIVN